MNRLEQAPSGRPTGVVDRLPGRNTRAVLGRHVVRPDGTCLWCASLAPCLTGNPGERISDRTSVRHATVPCRNELTRRNLAADPASMRRSRSYNRRSYG